jgi:hypothetical protein
MNEPTIFLCWFSSRNADITFLQPSDRAADFTVPQNSDGKHVRHWDCVQNDDLMMRVIASIGQTASSSEETTSCSPHSHHFRDVLFGEAPISRNGENEPYSSPDCESHHRHFLQATLSSLTDDLFRLPGGAEESAIIIPSFLRVPSQLSMVHYWPKECGVAAVTLE